jgi:hypothetical protein
MSLRALQRIAALRLSSSASERALAISALPIRAHCPSVLCPFTLTAHQRCAHSRPLPRTRCASCSRLSRLGLLRW